MWKIKTNFKEGKGKMKGKLIVIEGTDCSGKETQTKLLVKYLKENNTKVFTMIAQPVKLLVVHF